MGSKFRLALVQLAVGSNKADNLARAVARVGEAARAGAQLVSLPECFNSPYGTQHFSEYSELVPSGASCQALSEAAKEHRVYLVGGSIPEREGEKLYNTSTVWCPEGHLIATHRKIHLFDIHVPGKITFTESEVLSPGSQPTTFSTPWGEVGLGICYDIRFAELAQLYRDRGCKLLIYPGAFNMTTGPAHWELLARARALDNQVFVATPSPARDTEAGYVAWGHSSVVNAWGEVISKAGEGEEIIYAEIDVESVSSVRAMIPISGQRRDDLYSVLDKEKPQAELRMNTSYQLESSKVVDTFAASELPAKTVFCRCWKSKKFPLCDGSHGKHNKACCDNLGPVIVTQETRQ